MRSRRLVLGNLLLLMVFGLPGIATADQAERRGEHRLPCNGVVSLYYGDELLWTRGPKEIRNMPELVAVPGETQAGITGLPLASLLKLKPDVAAIELESCKPRLRRFDKAQLQSEHGANLYLVATNYRGFRLRNAARKRGGGGGMKNIGRIVLVPGPGKAGVTPGKKTGPRRGQEPGKGSGNGTGSEPKDKPGDKTQH